MRKSRLCNFIMACLHRNITSLSPQLRYTWKTFYCIDIEDTGYLLLACGLIVTRELLMKESAKVVSVEYRGRDSFVRTDSSFFLLNSSESNLVNLECVWRTLILAWQSGISAFIVESFVQIYQSNHLLLIHTETKRFENLARFFHPFYLGRESKCI